MDLRPIAIALALAVPTSAAAQSDTPPGQPAKSPAAQKRAIPSTPEAMAKKAEALMNQQRTEFSAVSALLAEARQAKDLIKANCLETRTEQMRSLLRISETAFISMQDQLSKAARETANGQFLRISLAASKSTLLRTEAQECVGLNAVYSGTTQVDVEVSDIGAGTDPTAPVTAPTSGPNLPPIASSF